MDPTRLPRTAQMRLATLLEIGRSLSAVTDDTGLRLRVVASLSRLFGADLLFCSAIDRDGTFDRDDAIGGDAGEARVLVLAHDGSAVRADQTYAPACDAATPEGGRTLDAPRARELGVADDAIGALVVPIRANERLAGELGAVRLEGGSDTFDAEDSDLLMFGAAIIGAALGALERVDETEARRREAERLEEIGRAITSSLDLDEVLERVMQAVIDLTEADSCSVWRREGDRSFVVASRGREALPIGLEIPVSPEIDRELVTTRRSIQIDDVSADPRMSANVRAEISGDGPRSAILTPMMMHDQVVGVLSVGHHESHRYGVEPLRILERLALQAAIAVENAALHSEIRELSLTDPLTGLPNRRHMEMVLAKEFEAARRGRPLAAVLLDLDDFKGYNDRHGHAGGDAALREFAAILTDETRAMNLAVRYGGDEFVVILSESGEEGAAHLIERIEERVRTHVRLREIGFSAGVAAFADEMSAPNELIEAADSAMYLRKSAPRSGA